MSISKITNITTNTISKSQKFSPKKIANAISEHKAATAFGTISAGLVGLALYSAAFLKPPINSNVKFDIAEAAQTTKIEENVQPKDIKKLEFEKTLIEKENNLKNIDVEFPLGTLICVTGVSGSGKSSLITETLSKSTNKRIKQIVKIVNEQGEFSMAWTVSEKWSSRLRRFNSK